MALKKPIRFAVILALLVAAVLGVRASLKAVDNTKPDDKVPVARVTRGNLELRVYATGDLQSTHSVTIIAPPVGGGTLQILHLAGSGAHINAGDVVVDFDPSEQQFNLEQARSDVAQADQEIAKAKADAAVQAAQDQVNLLKDRFDVRQAELEVSRNELVSAIDAKKNLLKLEEAKRVLAQIEQDAKSHATSSQAGIAVSQEKHNKAALAIEQAQRNIDNMTVKSPISGFVRVRENERASGGIFFPGMTLPEYRAGDQVFPGTLIGEVLDTSQMQLTAKISESDRTNLKPGQPAEVRVDALPGEVFHGKVKTVGATASRSEWWSSDSSQKFSATFELDHPEPRLRPGLTAQLAIMSGAVQGALLVPRQAIFVKEGKPAVYVKTPGGFVKQEVHIQAVNEGQAAVEGLEEGSEVALVNPEEKASSAAAAPSAIPLTGAGGSR
jgi:HlyD family secretion protein